METWPVDPRCSEVLESLLTSHDLCPLPAYEKNTRLLPPTQYKSKLKGATVEVHFAFIHHYIKAQKCHVYVPTLRELHILSPPAALPTSPYKRPRVRASGNKGKGRQTWSPSFIFTLLLCTNIPYMPWHLSDWKLPSACTTNEFLCACALFETEMPPLHAPRLVPQCILCIIHAVPDFYANYLSCLESQQESKQGFCRSSAICSRGRDFLK